MPEPTDAALQGLLSQWGISDTTVQDQVTTTLRDFLQEKNLQPSHIHVRWGVATIYLPPHQAHLANLLLDDLTTQASTISNEKIREVHIRAHLAPSTTSAYPSRADQKDPHHG